MLIPLSLLLLLCSLLPSTLASADYHERLLLQPLSPSSLLASFNFRSNTSSSAFHQQNFRFFPRSLGQILQHANTRELHLRFSLGRWDAESWGARPWNGSREGGTGVELWAFVEAESDEQADAWWLTLTNALSGLFCASLNFIDSTRTIRPVMSFQPTGHHSQSTLSNLHLLHGTLPREPVCTENLTPFLKLLPCKGKAGISSLLDGHKLFDASWQSMSIDVRPLCPEDMKECILEIDQTIDMVLDIERSKRHRDNPIPRPVPVEDLVCDTSKPYHSNDVCYPLDRSSEPPWSLSEIFGRQMKGSCPLVETDGPDSEPICIKVPHEREVYISNGAKEHKLEDGFTRCFEVPENEDFELKLNAQTLHTHTPVAQPPLYAERSFTGHGQERGGVQTLLTNPSITQPVTFVYLESLPWFMKPYLHTLRTEISSPSISPSHPANTTIEPILQDLYYRPALDRHRPTHLEMLLSVPPNSTVTLTYDFEKAILRYTEYPPDANRGFDVAPAIIRLISPTSSSSSLPFGTGATDPSSNVDDITVGGTASQPSLYYLRTTSLLLSLPTPDFSMPYNVIILTSTVMALAFGMVFNLLVRRFVGADEMARSNLGVLKDKVTQVRRLVASRWLGKGEKED
ncbi:MAG: Subunit of the glycosylphosphatidylinositol transamidase complex-like protein [Sclerophora amabilis]|nr:MAG: Subunit of the glycosylphosphatidylinositol transamidase complex-like protein [Sclerophora amabilis]